MKTEWNEGTCLTKCYRVLQLDEERQLRQSAEASWETEKQHMQRQETHQKVKLAEMHEQLQERTSDHAKMVLSLRSALTGLREQVSAAASHMLRHTLHGFAKERYLRNLLDRHKSVLGGGT